MRLETINQTKEFNSLKDHWNSLLSESPANSVYLTWEWLFTWWEVYGDTHRTLNIICIKDDTDSLVAIAPLIVTVKQPAPFIKRRVLEFLGTGEDEKDEVCSNYMDFIVANDADNVVHLLKKELSKGIAQGRWDEVFLSSVPMESVLVKEQGTGYSLSPVHSMPCAIIDLPNSWDEYLSSIKRNWRYQIKKGREDLGAKGPVECVDATDPSQIYGAFNDLVELHQRRWVKAGMPGAFASKKFSSFHKKILDRFSANGWVGIRLLKVSGKTVAASYRFLYSKTVYFYQAGYDAAIPSKIGLGMLERSFDIEEAIKSGFRRYDFYKAKAGSYKWHFAKDRREVTDVRVVRQDVVYQIERGIKIVRGIKRKFSKMFRDSVKMEGGR